MQPQSLPTSPRSFRVRGKCAGYEFDSSIQLGSHSMQHSDRGVTPAANHAHLQFLFHVSRFVLNEHMLSLFNDSVLSAMRRLPVYWSDPSWRITPQPMRTSVVFDLAAAPLAYKPR